MQRRKDIMLCYPFEERRLTDPKFGWDFKQGVYTQPKLNGIRATTRRNEDGQVILVSSEGNIFPIPHITEVLENMKLSFDLDGELYCHGKSFEWISSRVKLGSYADVKELQYHIFDVWNPEASTTFNKRYQRLWNLFSLLAFSQRNSTVQLVPTTLLQSPDSSLILDYISEELNNHVNNGYEGIIIRCYSAFYEMKRSRFVMKFKPSKTDCYRIVGIKQAYTMEGTPKGMVGAFIVVSPDSSQEFKISAGRFTHEERVKMWEQRPLGKFLEFQYQNRTAKNDFQMAFGIEIKENFSG